MKRKYKQDTNGLFISCTRDTTQTKWVSGNKKRYVAYFTPDKNYFKKYTRRSCKVTIKLSSGQNENWGGYSPAYKCTRTIK